jgi:predicted outer membrane repeat protein
MRSGTVWAGFFLFAFTLSTAGAAPVGFEVKLRSRSFTPERGIASARQYLAARTGEGGHLMLQLENPGDPAGRGALEAAGVRFLKYLPDNTWLAFVPSDLFERPGARFWVRWAAPLSRDDRLHPRLHGEVPRSWSMAPDGRWRLYVRFFYDVSNDEARAALDILGAEITHESPAFRAFEVVIAPSAFESLAADDRAMWIREVSPPPVVANDSNRDNTNAGTVQNPPYGLDGTGITVAIWDEGPADQAHPDFAGRITVGDGSSSTSAHGTHCTGTIGGSGANSANHGGTSLEWRGMAPNVGLVSYSWDDPIAELDGAINTYGASVSSNSWTISVGEGNCDLYGDYDWGAPDFDEIIGGLYGAPISIAFAAGNERNDGECETSDYGQIPPPSTGKNIITVGAIHSNNDLMTSFSSWGPMDDGRIKPEVVAPGCQSNDDFGVTSTVPGGGYDSFCGTSMATPTTSGCVALLQQAFSDARGELASPSLVRALLINTARDLGMVGPDFEFGFGAVDVQAAIDQFQVDAFAEGTLMAEDETVDHIFYVQPGQETLQVTLAWTDPAAAPLAGITLVNDLNLVLIDPFGNDHEPWKPNYGRPDEPATRGINFRDVVEQVTVSDPQSGQWIARVSSPSLPEGPQEYSLAGTSPDIPCVGGLHTVPGDFATIGAALAAASACDTILVAPGTYTEPTLVVDEAVVLKGDGGAGAVILDPFFTRAMTITADATIEGLTFTDGFVSGGFPGGYGGAVFIQGAAPVIKDCVFDANRATGGGGAIFATLGSPRIANNVFRNNHCNAVGGAIAFDTVTQGLITGNLFHDNDADNGAAIRTVNSSATIQLNTIAENVADVNGGGVYVAFPTSGSGIALTGNIVATNGAVSGGGIFCESSVTVNLDCNDVWSNGTDYVGCSAGPNDFSLDPLFCDPAEADYGIPPESPCAPANSPAECGRVGAYDPATCGGVIDVPANGGGTVPRRFAVHPAQPNPLSRATQVRVDLTEPADVRLTVFDVSGRLVRTVTDTRLMAGSHALGWDGRDASGQPVTAGVYFYELVAGAHRVTHKLVVVP